MQGLLAFLNKSAIVCLGLRALALYGFTLWTEDARRYNISQHSLSVLSKRSNLLSSKLAKWSQATKCLQTLAKQIPTPQTKRTTLMILMNIFDKLSSPGTLLFKKANKPCVVSHGGEHTLMSRRDEKMRLKWWICDMSLLFKEMSVSMCVLNQGPSPKTKHIEISWKFQNWILRLQSIHAHMQTVQSNKQKPSKPWKLSFVNLWKSLHTLKSRSPAHTSSKRSFAQTEPQRLFPACCRTASAQTFLPFESVSRPWNTRQRW